MTPSGFTTSSTFCWLSIVWTYLFIERSQTSTWSEWWTYEGISGPDFWGLVNPEWNLCSKGKRQSPINIDSSSLLFDPYLSQQLRIDKNKVGGYLTNSGHDVRLIIDEPAPTYVNVSGGPLSYQYRISEIIIHFGSTDKEGSEHAVNNLTFPAEIQILGYNSELYGNVSQAQYSSNGLLMIAILVQIGKSTNPELEQIAQHLKFVRYKGQQVNLRYISISELIPDTDDFITYEGSLTQPGCQETVTWVLINRPIYISADHMKMLRELMQGGPENPKAPMVNNFRPITATNQRPIRTNINFRNPTSTCTMKKQNYYQANDLEPS